MPHRLTTIGIDAILQSIRSWLKLLAKQDFEQAADFLYPIPGARPPFSAEMIRDAVGRYNRSYREATIDNRAQFLPNVTDPDLMDLSHENMVIYTRTDVGIAIVEYELPIERVWSDLTAKFIILQLADSYGLGLQDLRVL